jgi:hypothetical protein
MRTSTIQEARELVSFATRTLDSLRVAGERLGTIAEAEDERSWLGAAERRIATECSKTQAALDAAVALPEFEAVRRATGVSLFEAYAEAVEALHAGLVAHVSAKNPLIEVLFPHQKFDKIRRASASARAYLAEFERRRNLAYVVRLAREPEYAFMPALLARVDESRDDLARHEAPVELRPDELEALRSGVFDKADELRAALAQARLLAEAALKAHPGLLEELDLDAKLPKAPPRRTATSETQPTT